MFRRQRERVAVECWERCPTEMSLTIGDRRRWWNRSMPIGRILLGLAGIFIIWFNWDAMADLSWGLSHRWTAQVHGDDVKVPFMWRVVPGSYNWNELHLERARWWRIQQFENIDVNFRQVRQPKTQEAQGRMAAADRQLDELDDRAAHWFRGSVQDTFIGGPVEGSQYKCIHTPLAADMTTVRCRSADHAVGASMIGPSGEPADWTALQQVLTTFAAQRYHQVAP